jgi:hypothetical protein
VPLLLLQLHGLRQMLLLLLTSVGMQQIRPKIPRTLKIRSWRMNQAAQQQQQADVAEAV